VHASCAMLCAGMRQQSLRLQDTPNMPTMPCGVLACTSKPDNCSSDRHCLQPLMLLTRTPLPSLSQHTQHRRGSLSANPTELLT
jgi:hypothetical protein